jgi:predicted nucleic acid-binding protein
MASRRNDRVFGDTFFFLAYLIEDDAAHSLAAEFFDEFEGRLVTSQWVLTELADAFASSANRSSFGEFYKALCSDSSIEIFPATAELFESGVNLFLARMDKNWSLTDCISFVVMEREGLTEALTGDHHFTQAGFTALLR